MSNQNLANELTHAAKLDPKRRGELAELAFMRKAANLGFAVAKPWGDSDRYDVVVRFDKTFWRVQIKSVLGKSPSRHHYRVQTKNNAGKAYSGEDIDFLVAYIFAEDLWYVFPAHVFEQKKSLCVKPGSKKSRLEQYHENWNLMRLAGASLPAPATPASPGEAPDGSTVPLLST
jgi:PD-(D/E)XK endonuclease